MKLSIIIPVYNTPVDYLQECLQSIKTSHLRVDFEIIIVNDGSTNQELISFLNQYQKPDTTVINKENGGVSSARNLGISIATGEFLICLDSDDLLMPGINEAVELLVKNSSYDVIYCDVRFFGDTDFYFRKSEFSLFRLVYVSNFLTPSSTVFRKSITEHFLFNEGLKYSEDKDFFARIANNGHAFLHTRISFCKYRKVFDNLSLSQQNRSLREQSENFIKAQFDPHKIISKSSVNQYVVNNFKSDKKALLKMIVIIFFPMVYHQLRKKKLLANDIVVG